MLSVETFVVDSLCKMDYTNMITFVQNCYSSANFLMGNLHFTRSMLKSRLNSIMMIISSNRSEDIKDPAAITPIAIARS